jgi:crotonobetainyl-CoA:carnitine CoA-transferase CaiB-like acyl-CoA transferase
MALRHNLIRHSDVLLAAYAEGRVAKLGAAYEAGRSGRAHQDFT